MNKKYESHGDGSFKKSDFKNIAEGVIFEKNVMVFHPETITIGTNVYVGHNTILKGYYKNEMTIGPNTWIGQNCFFHSAGGLQIGSHVGIGPYVKIITSTHDEKDTSKAIIQNEIRFDRVIIESGSDIGIGSIIMPGCKIGAKAIIGAGSVVTGNIPEYAVAAGVPARIMRYRNKNANSS
jgi:acetyltransferase-like isoleucine patch superfamily enzyme